MTSWQRLRFRFLAALTHQKMLNRRAEVEQILFNVANGKRPPLTKDECRQLAFKLGQL